MKESRKFLVNGLVQGVWFRKFVADNAKILALTGWVRNTEDGQVELLAYGDPNSLDQLEQKLWIGSPLSRVSNVSSELTKDKPTTSEFHIFW